ncbi:MAG: UDP-glucose 4-epimerase GalE [Bacillota bacterium]
MNVLVCGGAGYIGSHAVRLLKRAGYGVLVLDSLVKGHRESIGDVPLIRADINDRQALEGVFNRNSVDAVMHFAAHSLVGESVARPDIYYRNNVAGTLNLLEAMEAAGVRRIIFSSTAAVYGEPVATPIREDHPTDPTNPYGATKLAVEGMLRWFAGAFGLKYISLRYFNAAGADPAGDIGEDHSPETHLIPLVLKAAAGLAPEVRVFGNDYSTPDGTCVRDYIHVNDLADAHILALQALLNGGGPAVYNLGNGSGFSVLEVIRAAESVTGRAIKTVMAERRPGDPAVLVASSEKARRELGWKPGFYDLETIISTAWKWHQSNPDGYFGQKSE